MALQSIYLVNQCELEFLTFPLSTKPERSRKAYIYGNNRWNDRVIRPWIWYIRTWMSSADFFLSANIKQRNLMSHRILQKRSLAVARAVVWRMQTSNTRDHLVSRRQNQAIVRWKVYPIAERGLDSTLVYFFTPSVWCDISLCGKSSALESVGFLDSGKHKHSCRQRFCSLKWLCLQTRRTTMLWDDELNLTRLLNDDDLNWQLNCKICVWYDDVLMRSSENWLFDYWLRQTFDAMIKFQFFIWRCMSSFFSLLAEITHSLFFVHARWAAFNCSIARRNHHFSCRSSVIQAIDESNEQPSQFIEAFQYFWIYNFLTFWLRCISQSRDVDVS